MNEDSRGRTDDLGVPPELVSKHIRLAIKCFEDALEKVHGKRFDSFSGTEPVALSRYVPPWRVGTLLKIAREMAVERGLNIQPRLEPIRTRDVLTDSDAIHYLMVENVAP